MKISDKAFNRISPPNQAAEGEMRKEFEMTEEQLAKLLDACKPTPAMYISGGIPIGGTPQENANAAWAALGREMGFVSMTAKPIPGKGQRFFTAESTETNEK